MTQLSERIERIELSYSGLKKLYQSELETELRSCNDTIQVYWPEKIDSCDRTFHLVISGVGWQLGVLFPHHKKAFLFSDIDGPGCLYPSEKSKKGIEMVQDSIVVPLQKRGYEVDLRKTSMPIDADYMRLFHQVVDPPLIERLKTA
jgi:hypothetical protein